LQDQRQSHPVPQNGYVHWSYALLSDGDKIPSEAFKCPATNGGGAPATNPGAKAENWEAGQVNDVGGTVGADTPDDRQAKRMAYTGNAAIFPRNKFAESGGIRRNQLVREARITLPFNTILATEFLANEVADWKAVFDGQVSKSHRSISPFIGGSSGTDIYNEPLSGGNTARFFYPNVSEMLRNDQLGPGMIRDGNSILNAVGRTHPGGDKQYGGTANFSFIDGHVERMTVIKSIEQRKWGDQYYSLTGPGTKVDNGSF
jgi:prepilin-type processing-associated H-X9-DG protein